MARALILAATIAMLAAVPARAANPPSASTFLKDRREVSAGTRAYSIGFEDGGFYAHGWHITGEMGGIWAPPLKLADGVWFGVDDQWVGPATRFTSGLGYTGYALPPIGDIDLTRVDFVPDDRRVAMYGLFLTSTAAEPRTVTVKVDVHSELMTAYPWAGSTGHPTAADNGKDTAAYLSGGTLIFSDGSYRAFARSDRPAVGSAIGDGGFRGPQPGTVCHDGDTAPPSACDDGRFGRGAGGELRYRVKLPGKGRQVFFWFGIGADQRDLDAVM